MMMAIVLMENHRHSRCRLRERIGACTDAIKTADLNGNDEDDDDAPRAVGFGPAAYFLQRNLPVEVER